MFAAPHKIIAAGLVLTSLMASGGNVGAQAPVVVVDEPERLVGQTSSQGVPATAFFHFTGADEDAASGQPTLYRSFFKPAWVEGVGYVATQFAYEQYVDTLVDFDDPSWSEWQDYPSDPAERRLVFENLPRVDDEGELIRYLFGVQVMDENGAVSLERAYGQQVVNFHVALMLAPLVTVTETHLGTYDFAGLLGQHSFDITHIQVLEFSWVASTDYGVEIAASRWGWDVIDPADSEDPGWMVPPGNAPENFATPPISFSSGVHTLTIHVWDELDQLTRATIVLDVVPIPDPANQRPLLLVDDVYDQNSNAWPSFDGAIAYDRDLWRDAFWEDLLTAASGGVEGFDPAMDIIDSETGPLPRYRDLVQYRAVILTERYTVAPANLVADELRPRVVGEDEVFAPYNWLADYQAVAGNLLLTGSRNQNAFLPEIAYTAPIVAEDGFYPALTSGLALLDQMSPQNYAICGAAGPGSLHRKRECVGMKGVLLDADFTDRYMGGEPAFADTILTEAIIDWQDLDADHRDNLLTYPWGRDEFYDADVSSCNLTWTPQDCDGEPCVEPMFRAYSRLDWNRDRHEAAGDDQWPLPYFTPAELEGLCGDLALDASGESALTNGTTVGFFNHKTKADKPSGKADVVWGFDSYRLDHDRIKLAVRWVLGEHFGLTLRR